MIQELNMLSYVFLVLLKKVNNDQNLLLCITIFS